MNRAIILLKLISYIILACYLSGCAVQGKSYYRLGHGGSKEMVVNESKIERTSAEITNTSVHALGVLAGILLVGFLTANKSRFED